MNAYPGFFPLYWHHRGKKEKVEQQQSHNLPTYLYVIGYSRLQHGSVNKYGRVTGEEQTKLYEIHMGDFSSALSFQLYTQFMKLCNMLFDKIHNLIHARCKRHFLVRPQIDLNLCAVTHISERKKLTKRSLPGIFLYKSSKVQVQQVIHS